MNAAHAHLLLNHVPILGTLFGVLLLGYGLWAHKLDFVKAGFITFVVTGASALLVFLNGEGAEEIVETIPGISGALIEAHEDVALFAMIAALLLGAAALAGLLIARKKALPPRFGAAVLVLGLVVTGAVGWTGYLGGQIHHTELRAAQGADATASPAVDDGHAGEHGGD